MNFAARKLTGKEAENRRQVRLAALFYMTFTRTLKKFTRARARMGSGVATPLVLVMPSGGKKKNCTVLYLRWPVGTIPTSNFTH